jgi:hypothetical protein
MLPLKKQKQKIPEGQVEKPLPQGQLCKIVNKSGATGQVHIPHNFAKVLAHSRPILFSNYIPTPTVPHHTHALSLSLSLCHFCGSAGSSSNPDAKMVAEPRSSDPVDPLSAYSGLALFPRTFGVAPDPAKPYDPDTDLDAIHNHLKSLVLSLTLSHLYLSLCD